MPTVPFPALTPRCAFDLRKWANSDTCEGTKTEVSELHKQGVQCKSLTGPSTPARHLADFFFHIMVSLAEMERKLIVERTRARLEVASKLGRNGGRKLKMTESKIEPAKKLLTSDVPPNDVAENLGVSVPTLHRWIPASTTA